MDDNYEFIKELGQGTFGTTWLAKNKSTGKKVAIKIFSRKREIHKEKSIKDWMWEVEMLSTVVKGCFPYAVCIIETYIENGVPRLVMDFVEGESVFDQLYNRSSIPNGRSKQKRLAHDLIKGIQIIHSQGLVHEDIKEENLMWDRHMKTYRYIDFGLSCVKKSAFVDLDKIRFPCGTQGTRYIASPDEEAYREHSPIVPWEILESHDYWSIGIVLLRWFTFNGKPSYYLKEYTKFLGKRPSESFINKTFLDGYHPTYYMLGPDFLESEMCKIKNIKMRTIVSLLLEFDGFKRVENFKQVVKIVNTL